MGNNSNMYSWICKYIYNIQPAIESKDYVSTGFQLAGPIVFGLVAFFLISRYEKKYGSNKDSIDRIA